MMNKKVLFDRLRAAYGPLAPSFVEGVEAILYACRVRGVANADEISNVFAQIKREVGIKLKPIKETGFNDDPQASDATVVRRLDNWWASSKARAAGVKAPYWRTGKFGRGLLQITHEDNYVKIGRLIGLPLSEDPDLLIRDVKVSALAAVAGMQTGAFRGGRKLSDYHTATHKGYDHFNARGIVNGDKNVVSGGIKVGNQVAKDGAIFRTALDAAGYMGRWDFEDDGETALPQTPPVFPENGPVIPTEPKTTPKPRTGWEWIVQLINAILGRK